MNLTIQSPPKPDGNAENDIISLYRWCDALHNHLKRIFCSSTTAAAYADESISAINNSLSGISSELTSLEKRISALEQQTAEVNNQ